MQRAASASSLRARKKTTPTVPAPTLEITSASLDDTDRLRGKSKRKALRGGGLSTKFTF
jgi:hypothetical protein